MAAFNMGDLMCEDSGEFVVRFKGFKKSTRHEDVPGRHGKRVDVVCVYNLKSIAIALERHGPSVQHTGSESIDLLLALSVDVRIVRRTYLL